MARTKKTIKPLKPTGKTNYYKCTEKDRDVRCECGGQLMVGGTIHPLADLGMGFNRKGKFEIKTKFSKKVIGYVGFCLDCQKDGQFLLPGVKPPN